jgi:hypothetical protein
MNAYVAWLHRFLNFAPDNSLGLASRHSCFNPKEWPPTEHLIGDGVGPRTHLNALEEKNPIVFRESNRISFVIQPYSSYYTY